MFRVYACNYHIDTHLIPALYIIESLQYDVLLLHHIPAYLDYIGPATWYYKRDHRRPSKPTIAAVCGNRGFVLVAGGVVLSRVALARC